MRRKLYQMIEPRRKHDRASNVYDAVMIVVILVSFIPLLFREMTPVLLWMERITTGIFIIDYVLRLITADFAMGRGKLSFLMYPFTPMALVDLCSILPAFYILGAGFRLLKVIRLFSALRVFRAFKIFRYSRSIQIMRRVVRDQKMPLIAVCSLAAAYIFISAMILFQVEPDLFDNFFDAIYWATISLTTIGYGDVVPVTTMGRLITMISAFVGIAVIAMPSSIITAGYIKQLNQHDDDGDNEIE